MIYPILTRDDLPWWRRSYGVYTSAGFRKAYTRRGAERLWRRYHSDRG